jgi:hypothetical protein
LLLVGDDERHLGRVRIAQPRVARERDDAVSERADERPGLDPVRVDERLDEPLVDATRAVEPEVEAAVGEAGEEGDERGAVRLRRRTQAQRAGIPAR